PLGTSGPVPNQRKAKRGPGGAPGYPNSSSPAQLKGIGGSALQVDAGATSHLFHSIAYRLGKPDYGFSKPKGKPKRTFAKPYDHPHGHGSLEERRLAIRLQIDSYTSGGPNPNFGKIEISLLTPEDRERLTAELNKRDQEKAVKKLRELQEMDARLGEGAESGSGTSA
ncbi:hypothetical protein EXIGLDRAFT_760856, partial [Exidia glandulosa HHB12029]